MPAYKLPSSQIAEPLEPKFIRDSHSVADIAGTKSRALYPWPERDNQRCNDIEGAQAGWRPRNERARIEAAPINHHYDVRDINNIGFKSTRTVCPLKPEYRINGMVIRDDPRYTEPKPLPPPSNHDFYSLKTDDIEGAAPGWVPPHECRPAKEDRKHFRNTNFVGDIPGAQADTVKHAIRTERVVNPLNPVYDSLDGDRLRPPMTPNILNGNPSKFGLSQPDSFKDAANYQPPSQQQPAPSSSVSVDYYEVPQPTELKSARDRSARSRESEFVPPKPSSAGSVSKVPPMKISQMNQTKDEKINALEQELSRLKAMSQSSGGGSRQMNNNSGGGVGSFRDDYSARQQASMSASAFVASARNSNGMNNNQMASTNRMPTERFTLRSGRSGGGGDMPPASSRSSQQPSFNPKSGNTTARSKVQTSSRRESAAREAEIASVRDL